MIDNRGRIIAVNDAAGPLLDRFGHPMRFGDKAIRDIHQLRHPLTDKCALRILIEHLLDGRINPQSGNACCASLHLNL